MEKATFELGERLPHHAESISPDFLRISTFPSL
jgi:hypothetical protein